LIGHAGRLPLPRPPTFDLKDERPAQEGANEHQPGQETEAHERQVQCDRFDDIGRDEHFKTQQERAADSNFVGLVVAFGHFPPDEVNRRPSDAGNDDEYPEDLDAISDNVDPMAEHIFELGEMLWRRVHGEARRWNATICYFARILDVMEAITFDAILSSASRSVMRWRREIQWKSV
jgi:hypothetical protein